MGLSRFPTAMAAAADAVLAVAEALRYVRYSRGDLTWMALHRVQDGLQAAKLTCIAACAEGERQPVSAEAFMASLGGPPTLSAFKTRMLECEAAAAAWNAALRAMIAELPTAEVITMIRRDEGARATSHIEHVPYLSQARADVLRQSAELAALIDAFEAVGA